ncbi:hypothetical protein Trco_003245 [Trichoderma cornu-damae]|uniref:Uncharacterized protein n=1 Tax=Trichoderma cornu-damae TaxID=654480 RepID=A0A9P8QRE2_9HYPO|nr:hypothetical protein Trco_003245 [Trichoderma cornu-damae]
MIVHSGASLHGHEFSDQQPDQAPARRFPFLSALRPLSGVEPISRRSSPAPDTVDSLPARPLSVAEPVHNPRSSLATRRRTTSDVVHTVRFREPHSDVVVVQSNQPNASSEDEESLVGSEVGDQTDASIRLKRRKREPRKSARFALAFPAPQLRTKQRAFFQIRPRVLLQLQELGEKRAIPAFDVVPSSLIAGTLIIPALAKQLPRMFYAKPHLGQNDLLLVRSEDYGPPHNHHLHHLHQHHPDHHHHNHHNHHNTDNDNNYSSISNSKSSNNNRSSSSSDNLDHKDVLAVVCTTSDDDFVEIVFQDGSSWVTSRMANGSYEFNHVNEQGEAVKARWVRRSLASPRASWGSANTASTTPSSPTSPAAPDCRWTFSIIDPSTRRHPIQGILNSTSLEIFDTYNTMSTSSGIYPPTRPFGSDMTGISEEDAASATDERATLEVTEYNKTLMLATAIWVSLRQRGWPASATPKIQRAVSQRVSSGRCQGAPVDGGPLGTTGSQAPSANAGPSPQDALAAVRNPASGRLRRAVSSGSEFMRRRREAAALASAASSIANREADQKREAELNVDETTATCRLRVRRLAQRIFHHSGNQRVS